jgi:hypothetical protein
MTATLTLAFNDGSTREISLTKAIEVDTPGRREISFREAASGWVMTFTKSLKDGKTFDSHNFITVSKNTAT